VTAWRESRPGSGPAGAGGDAPPGAGPVGAVCVYCASSTRIDPAHLDLAASVGTGLARLGCRLVTGGGSISMMGAVTAAARAAGGYTIGVIPRQLLALEVGDLRSDELIVVDTMRERKAEMERRADAFLALPGGLGTLEELFEVWTAASLGLHAKPVVVLDPDGFYDPLWRYLEELVHAGFVRRPAFDLLRRTVDLPSALAALDGRER
jgi:uncharacterized protein (TIGR00730 family)